MLANEKLPTAIILLSWRNAVNEDMTRKPDRRSVFMVLHV
jgi:hypothetical protein